MMAEPIDIVPPACTAGSADVTIFKVWEGSCIFERPQIQNKVQLIVETYSEINERLVMDVSLRAFIAVYGRNWLKHYDEGECFG